MSNEAVSQILDNKPVMPQQQNVGEAAPTETSPQVARDDNGKFSNKIEVLIRREREAVARERALKDKEAEIEAKLVKYNDFDGAKTNPKKALELLGMSYDELTQSLLNDGSIPPEVQIRKVDEKIEALRKSQEEDKQRQADDNKRRQDESEKAAVFSFKKDITTYLTDNKVRYELIDFEGQQELVFDVIDEHYNRTLDPETGVGKVMSVAEAADKVEEFLEQKYHKSRNVSKVKALWEAVPKAPIKEAAKQELQQQRQPPRTLTNNLSATQMPRAKVLTDEERVQKAIAYAQSLRPSV